ncbi:MAG TPA: thiamine phosphate synthase [Alloprevotella sp.]|nr:thiamine phosphate synthase [Alloprevotella sp.]
MVPIQFITHFTERISYEESALLALQGGCRWIQLRMKNEPDETVEPIALRLQKACREAGATFIIDDRVRLVKKIKADGVHLGKEDMPVAEARRFLGEEFLIGGTANTADDVLRLKRESADYVGCGPFRFTTTKQKLAPILGLEGYRTLMHRLAVENLSIPVCAIGGITLADIPEILATGVRGIAVSGSILNAADPIQAMRDFIAADS